MIGKHIENGLNRVAQAIEQHTEFQRESYWLGFIPKENKIKILEAEAYRMIRVGQDASQHFQMIRVLQSEIERERAKTPKHDDQSESDRLKTQ